MEDDLLKTIEAARAKNPPVMSDDGLLEVMVDKITAEQRERMNKGLPRYSKEFLDSIPKPKPYRPAEAVAAKEILKADPLATAASKATSIGPPKVGDRFMPTQPQENLFQWLLEKFTGPRRPTSVAAQDPYGIGAWEKGVGSVPVMASGTIEGKIPSIAQRLRQAAKGELPTGDPSLPAEILYKHLQEFVEAPKPNPAEVAAQQALGTASRGAYVPPKPLIRLPEGFEVGFKPGARAIPIARRAPGLQGRYQQQSATRGAEQRAKSAVETFKAEQRLAGESRVSAEDIATHGLGAVPQGSVVERRQVAAPTGRTGGPATVRKGRKGNMSIDLVKEIKRLGAAGVPLDKVRAQYPNIPRNSLREILNGDAWGWVKPE